MSTASWHLRTQCCLCSGSSLDRVLSLQPSPIADDYQRPEHVQSSESYPLELALCQTCGHVQLTAAVNPEILFRNYTFVSASSLGLVQHLKQLAQAALRRSGAKPNDLAVDIGSNDGSLLEAFKELNIRALGIDPAREVSKRANEIGRETICDFFTLPLARRIRSQYGPAKIVTAANVFAHSECLPDIADGIRELLAPDGVFIFEVSYLADMIDAMVFDTIYHEHISYHTVAPLVSFFRRHGLELIEIERIASKGGSLRGYVQLQNPNIQPAHSVVDLLALESHRTLATPTPFIDFAARIEMAKFKFIQAVDKARSQGQRLAGYGASVTTTTLLHHFELNERLEFLVDDNPLKQGTLSPGRHLPVLPSQALYEKKPQAVIILAWQYAEPILRRHERFLTEGGNFLIPLPALREVRN